MEENLGEVIQQIPFLGSLPEMRKKAILEKAEKVVAMAVICPFLFIYPNVHELLLLLHLSVVFISLVGQEE